MHRAPTMHYCYACHIYKRCTIIGFTLRNAKRTAYVLFVSLKPIFYPFALVFRSVLMAKTMQIAIINNAHMLSRRTMNSFVLRDVSLTYFDMFVCVNLAFCPFLLVFRRF